MGYNIDYTDLRTFQIDARLAVEEWKDELLDVLEAVEALISSESDSGASADGILGYLQDVIREVMMTLVNVLCEYSGKNYFILWKELKKNGSSD